MAHIVLPRTQIKSQQLRDAVAHMRMTMSIDGKPADRGAALTHDAFDGRADLPTQQRQRLFIEDAPLIENGLVRAHAMDSALRIYPRIVQVFAGVETHQIRRGFIARSTVIDDAVTAREL